MEEKRPSSQEEKIMALTYNNIALKVRNILTTHGQDVYFRRRCAQCTQSGERVKYDKDCVYCHGFGYVQELERHTMRKQIVGSMMGYPSSTMPMEMGMLQSESTYFFCLPDVRPKIGDLIYDFNNGTLEYDCYEIKKAMERRYDSRVVYWTCATEIKESIV